MEFPPARQVFLDEDLETATQQVEGMATMDSKCVFSVLPRVGIASRKYFT
jgi:hypothetical protein